MDALIPALAALVGLWWLINIKKVTAAIIERQQSLRRGKPLPKYAELSIRVLVLFACLTFVILGSYDAITSYIQES